jgi:membrane glycosyltransferase
VAIFGLTIIVTAMLGREMFLVLSVSSIAPLQLSLLIAFTINVLLIVFPFVTALAGFIQLWCGHNPSAIEILPYSAEVKLTSRTALLIPIYNECPPGVFARVQAMYESLSKLNTIKHFDIFILSDSTLRSTQQEEEAEFAALERRIGDSTHLFYRHRAHNVGRKAGNIMDFCRNWGPSYDFMVTLDADSLMAGETLVQLATTMESHSEAGLIQTVPILVNGDTVFARMQQFVSRVHGPVVAAGLAYWHRGDGNYWGHNAIIRTTAFIQHAGLPTLSGHPPFGGHILSHDFVEAALMRRAGWKLYLATDLGGSYEECPATLVDFAARDRRWCQGNLQHSRVVAAKGLYWVSRLHLALGIMSYLASPIWLVFLLLGITLVSQLEFLNSDLYAGRSMWDTNRAVWLFICVMSILVTPKLLGFLLLLRHCSTARCCGGAIPAALSVVFETVTSALIAPVMMLMQSDAVLGILTGQDVGWCSQARQGSKIPMRVIMRRHASQTILGLLFAIEAVLISPAFFAWVSPLILGMVLSIPLSAASGARCVGSRLRRLGLLVTPEEVECPAILRRANELTDQLVAIRETRHIQCESSHTQCVSD